LRLEFAKVEQSTTAFHLQLLTLKRDKHDPYLVAHEDYSSENDIEAIFHLDVGIPPMIFEAWADKVRWDAMSEDNVPNIARCAMQITLAARWLRLWLRRFGFGKIGAKLLHVVFVCERRLLIEVELAAILHDEVAPEDKTLQGEINSILRVSDIVVSLTPMWSPNLLRCMDSPLKCMTG
jgi:hypothetical protein